MKKRHEPESKTVVLKPQVNREKIDELIDSKKTGYFKHLFSKPEKHEIHVHSVTLIYEPYMILSGIYEADFLRRAKHPIKVDHNVKEIFLGDGIFPIHNKSSFLTKLEGNRGKNKIELEVDEHVFVTDSKEIILDHHGTERSFPYKLESITKENYPKRVLGKNSVKEIEITTESAIQKLEEKLRENSIDYEVKNLNENFRINEITEVYVPIYEARLVGPKKKVQIMRIDAVRQKIL